MESSIEDLISVRYVLFPDTTHLNTAPRNLNAIDLHKTVKGGGGHTHTHTRTHMEGQVGPHMSMTTSKCDMEDLCRVQAGQAEGFVLFYL